MYTIKVRQEVIEASEKIIERVKAGQTLLEVLLKNKIEIPHHCGGMCYCTSCMINVKKGSNFLEEKSKREIDFLNKAKNHNDESRLACQCLLLEGESFVSIEIPE